MTPSKYQLAVYDWIKHGKGDGAVDAVAGSGKTSTLVAAASLVPAADLLFLAFNKSIVEVLKDRLPTGSQVQTLNSLGHRALGRHLGGQLNLHAHKYDDIVHELLRNEGIPSESYGDAKRAVKQLVSYAQSSLSSTSDEALADLADHYGVDVTIKGVWESALYSATRATLRTGESQGRKGLISFDDQIWLPVLWGLKPAQSKWVFVDECQDLSAAKLELVLSATHPEGRRLFVGDPFQAIYGFAGADAASFQNIVTRTTATVLPLSISYRCPQSVVEVAQTIVPSIEAAPDAIPGLVQSVRDSELHSTLKAGDLILCRLTAPLIRLCIELIGRKVAARVKGRDIGTSLITTAREALNGGDWTQFGILLDAYRTAKSAVLSQRKHPESALAALEDKVQGVRACYESFQADSFSGFQAQVQNLFSDDGAVIELSTIHRAKGLEADHVFIIKPETLPLTWKGQLAWQAQQEQNLRYVAITRAKRSLSWVDSSRLA
jgi:superfamily I DNA/RNA helicase